MIPQILSVPSSQIVAEVGFQMCDPSISLFVDDAKLLGKIYNYKKKKKKKKDFEELQNDINKIYEWEKRNLMQKNIMYWKWEKMQRDPYGPISKRKILYQ